MNDIGDTNHSAGRVVDVRHVLTMFDTAAKKAEEVAIVQGHNSWTYARFAADVRRISRGLVAQGVTPGDRVVLHLGNCIPAALACWAGMAVGAVVVPLSTNLKGPELTRMLRRVEPALYLGHAELKDVMADIDRALLPDDRRFVIDETMPAGRNWEALLGSEDPGSIPLHDDVDAPALLLTTSGTTGEPKLVVRTQRALAHQAALATSYAVRATSILLCPTPLFHAPGVFAIVCGMALGARVVLPACREFDPGAFLDAIALHGCTWLLCSPFGISELISTHRKQPRDIDSLVHCLVGGDAAPPMLHTDFESAFSVQLNNILGMTEGSGSLAIGTTPQSLRAVPGLARLFDDSGKPTPRGELGELAVRGEHMFKGYWRSAGVVDDPKVDGWFRTGDMMWEGDDSELHYASRKKHVIVRDGENIAPVEVERVLLSHPAVTDAAVTGIPDAALGQRVVGLIVPADPAKHCDTVGILHIVSQQLSHYKVPEILAVVERIPRNAFRKMDRAAVADMAMQLSCPPRTDM